MLYVCTVIVQPSSMENKVLQGNTEEVQEKIPAMSFLGAPLK